MNDQVNDPGPAPAPGETFEPKKAVVILNPTADRGGAAKKENTSLEALRETGLKFDLLHTAEEKHATMLARDAAAAGADLIVAAGGDGTVHEVAQGMWDTDAVLGVMPMGSGNDFAQAHGIPRDLERAAAIIRSGKTGRTDVGRCDDWTFFNTVGIGFDACVSKYSRRIKRLRGNLLYLAAVLQTFRKYRSTHFVVDAPGYSRSEPTYLVMVGIGPREGGGFTLAPDAIVDDGMFDVCIVDDIRVPTVLRMIPRAMKGTHTDMSFVTMLRVPVIRISTTIPIMLHADGQIYHTGKTTLAFDCKQGGLRVRMASE